MLQTNVIEADHLDDQSVCQFVRFASGQQIGISTRAIGSTNKVQIPSISTKRETVAVENRLVVKNEWQPVWPFPRPRVQTMEHSHQTFDILAGARITDVQIASQALVAVDDYRKPPDQHVLNGRLAQQPEDPFWVQRRQVRGVTGLRRLAARSHRLIRYRRMPRWKRSRGVRRRA